MKKKLILRTTGIIIFMISIFVFYSCSKSENAGSTKEQNENQDLNTEVIIDEKNFSESDEDLTTVDYKEIYDRLTPHGEWLQVKPEEIGMKPETAFFEVPDSKSMTLSGLVGVKDSYAETVADDGTIFVWKPSVDLGVTAAAGEAKVYVPYTNGQWVNTDAGWYFKAPTPAEETVSHFGRWVNSPSAGWLWVPGRVWAPAWVDWKQNETYVSWAPLPPSVYLNNGILRSASISDNNYFITEKKYFLEPDVYKYNSIYYTGRNPVLISSMTGTQGLVVENNTIVNKGPDVNIFQTLYKRNIDIVKVQRVRNFNEVRYTDREYAVYYPVFKKFKNKGNKKVVVNVPGSYKNYDEWKIRTNKEKNSENNGNDNNENYNGNENKSYDNGNKNNSENNGNTNNGNKKNNGDKSKDKRSKNNGNDNNNKHKESDNSNKHNGNDNNNKDNGNKNNNNDNGKGK